MIETGLSTILGGIATVYPAYVPEDTSGTAIVYKRISTTGSLTHDGPSNLVAVVIQFTVIAEAHETALTTAQSISDLLEVFSGVVGTSVISFVHITNIIDLGHFPEMNSWQVAVDATFHEE